MPKSKKKNLSPEQKAARKEAKRLANVQFELDKRTGREPGKRINASLLPPAAEGEQRQYGGGFKRKSSSEDLIDVELPSGSVVQIARPGIEDLIASGMLNDVDGLTSVVAAQTIPTAEGRPAPPKTLDPQALLADPSAFAKTMKMMNTIVVAVVRQPLVKMDPTDKEPGDHEKNENGAWILDPEAVYVSQIGLEDRSAIMEAALGGAEAFADFRPGS
jgi:hypothetical protein